MSDATEAAESIIEDISVNDLEIDRTVQRTGINQQKVARIKASFNPDAVGVGTVSRRKNGANILIDGQHRARVIAELTDGTGTFPCEVYTGLTLAEEAKLFLDKNNTTQPPAMDRFRVSLETEGAVGEVARAVRQTLSSFGWAVGPSRGRGIINCVNQVLKLQRQSLMTQAEPDLLHMTILVITRAWGDSPDAVHASIIDAIGSMFDQYGERLKADEFIQVLTNYSPRGLVGEGKQLSALRKLRLPMAIADILVETYNKGQKSPRAQLTRWNRR